MRKSITHSLAAAVAAAFVTSASAQSAPEPAQPAVQPTRVVNDITHVWCRAALSDQSRTVTITKGDLISGEEEKGRIVATFTSRKDKIEPAVVQAMLNTACGIGQQITAEVDPNGPSTVF
jgi:hypothetical protein